MQIGGFLATDLRPESLLLGTGLVAAFAVSGLVHGGAASAADTGHERLEETGNGRNERWEEARHEVSARGDVDGQFHLGMLESDAAHGGWFLSRGGGGSVEREKEVEG
jgi:hypothetical protein